MKIQELYNLFLKTGSVSTDTRNIKQGSIFFALKGDNFNGNKFVEEAIKLGAYCALTDEKEFENPGLRIYYTEDCLKTLQDLANYHRKKLNTPVISLTGSNGKTTTKELISKVLSQKYNLIATHGNLNNHIGVPITLLSLKYYHELAIVEMGANHLNEIDFLCKIAEPDLGYITNFGKAHLEGFGGVEGVIKGKSELYHYLKKNNKTVFVNCDDKKQSELTEEMERISFGECENSDFKFSYTDNYPGLCPFLTYENKTIKSQLTGSYNITNVAAAVAIGLHFKVPFDHIKRAIESYQPDNNRSQIIEKGKYKIILDAYNANPSSMEAALNNFKLIEGDKMIILGDMFELGENSDNEHIKIVEMAEKLNFNKIFLIGQHFSKINQNEFTNLKIFENRQAAEDYFKNNKPESKNLLIKGSRGMALEKLLDFIDFEY